MRIRELFFIILLVTNAPSVGRSDYLISGCVEALSWAGSKAGLAYKSLLPPLKTKPIYPTFPVIALGKILDAITTLYFFTPRSREPFRCIIKNGLVFDSKMQLVDTGGTFGIFIMDTAGNFYIGPSIWYTIHHSSFLAGGEVASAGDLFIVKGQIRGITRQSGHYYTPLAGLLNGIGELSRERADLSQAEARLTATGETFYSVADIRLMNKETLNKLAY